jgi:hypothetical protein
MAAAAIGALSGCDDGSSSDAVSDVDGGAGGAGGGGGETPDAALGDLDAAPAEGPADAGPVVDAEVDARQLPPVHDFRPPEDPPVDAAVDAALSDVTSCVDDPEVCVQPYVCVGGTCRLPLAGTAWSETGFQITEPEELTRVFDLLKALATGVSFMVVAVEPGEGAVARAEYGAANIVDSMAVPRAVEWQRPVRGRIEFRPAGAEVEDASDSWQSDPFVYRLEATVDTDLVMMEVAIGLEVESAEMLMVLDPSGSEALAALNGIVTRAETEDRFLGTTEQLGQLRNLICPDEMYMPADGVWRLSDILDCNGAELTGDADGDGELDGYRAGVEARFVPAEIVERQ